MDKKKREGPEQVGQPTQGQEQIPMEEQMARRQSAPRPEAPEEASMQPQAGRTQDGAMDGFKALAQVIGREQVQKARQTLQKYKEGNWNCFMGLATDSYAASCGTDGPFTGAITHLGYPLFFKENCVHKVYGNYPANFQIQSTACRGVQKGCHGSLAIVNETLFYKARSGICAYDGSLPTEASYALGNGAYSDAAGGAHGNKYYVSMKDTTGVWNLFVYDTAKGMWHKEDHLHVSAFCSFREEMYCVDADSRNILTLLGSGEAWEDRVPWMVETGELGISSPDMKYISRLTIRMALEIGSEMNIYAQYDLSDEWVHVCNIKGTSLRSFSIPIRPRRCDHMKLRIVGIGAAKIYSETKTIEQGSDVS